MIKLPRIGIFLLGSMMKRRGWDVEVIFEETREIDFADLQRADLVGISTITPTALRAYEIADKVRAMGITVIMGGPHVSFLPDEALAHADFVVRGEGERALMSFIDAWEGNRDYSRVPNLTYVQNGVTVTNPSGPFIADLNELPFPDFALSSGQRQPLAGQNVIPIQTSRGCPFDCSFCSVTAMFGKKYRYRSTESVIEELRRYDTPGNFIFFYDDNFTANRTRVYELLEEKLRQNFKFKWSTQVRADVAKDVELVKLMKKAGCHTLFIGFESVNPESLMSMKKKQTVEEIEHAIRTIQGNGIHIHGMFVNGFDEDDWRSVKETVKFIKKTQLTSIQFMILTPLPGSEFYARMVSENRLTTNDWSLYDAHHAVYRARKFSQYDIQMAQIYGHKKVYSVIEMLKKLLQRNWVALGLALYARVLNRNWRKLHKPYLKKLKALAKSEKLNNAECGSEKTA